MTSSKAVSSVPITLPWRSKLLPPPPPCAPMTSDPFQLAGRRMTCRLPTGLPSTMSCTSCDWPASGSASRRKTLVRIRRMTTATFDTSEGTFKVKLFDDKAPNTVANFVGLAEGTKEWTDPKTGQKVKKPFYDGLIFHRVIDGFMIQGGCPMGNGMGGPGYKFADEFGPG